MVIADRPRRIKRIQVLVERNKKRAGYAFWVKGMKIAQWWTNHSWIDKKMGPKRSAQWWSGSLDLDTREFRLIQPLNKPVQQTSPVRRADEAAPAVGGDDEPRRYRRA